jgi:choline dehydrogenase-like flavoprotein
MRDWPIGYEELAPYYAVAERVMAIAGAANRLMPGTDYPQPAHPLSTIDRTLARHVEPFIALPQARPTRPVGKRPACCGSARCELCPVDARFSVLNGLAGVLDDRRARLLTDTVAARLVAGPRGARIDALECVDAKHERLTLRADRFVIAANAIESPALLMRSGIDHGDTGRYLEARPAAQLAARTRKPHSHERSVLRVLLRVLSVATRGRATGSVQPRRSLRHGRQAVGTDGQRQLWGRAAR